MWKLLNSSPRLYNLLIRKVDRLSVALSNHPLSISLLSSLLFLSLSFCVFCLLLPSPFPSLISLLLSCSSLLPTLPPPSSSSSQTLFPSSFSSFLTQLDGFPTRLSPGLLSPASFTGHDFHLQRFWSLRCWFQAPQQLCRFFHGQSYPSIFILPPLPSLHPFIPPP